MTLVTETIRSRPITSEARLARRFGRSRTCWNSSAQTLAIDHAFGGQFEAVGGARAERHAEVSLQAPQGEADGRLLAPEARGGARQVPALHDHMEGVEQVPVEVPREAVFEGRGLRGSHGTEGLF